MGGVLTSQGESTHIGYDQRIYACIIQLLQIGRQVLYLVVAGHDVDGHVGFDTVVMGKFDGFRQFFRGEVTGKGAHTEVGTGQIHSISAVEYGHLQFFHIPSGAKQF